MPAHTLSRIAERLGGRVEGDPELVLERVRPPEEAGAGEIAVLMEPRLVAAAEGLAAAALVVPESAPVTGRPLVRVKSPRRAFVELLRLFHGDEPRRSGVEPGAFVSPRAVLGAGVFVAAGSTVGAGAVLGAGCQVQAGVRVGDGVTIGDDTVLFPNVVLYPGTRVGNRVRIHAGTVVGSDGFGYERDAAGVQRKVPQVGTVEICDDVEIGANTTIDRATLGVTRIGAGTKIDNLVQIGHNCELGEHCCLVGQAGLSGSVKLGRFTVLAGQAGVADHVTIAEGTVVGAQSGVPNDLGPGVWLGTPALPSKQMARVFAALAKLPELRRQVAALEERCRRLEAESGAGAGP